MSMNRRAEEGGQLSNKRELSETQKKALEELWVGVWREASDLEARVSTLDSLVRINMARKRLNKKGGIEYRLKEQK